jgi:hypothetical protein
MFYLIAKRRHYNSYVKDYREVRSPEKQSPSVRAKLGCVAYT